MTHLTLFIGVGDGAGLKLLHRSKRFLKTGLHRIQMRCVDMHSADVQPDPKIVVVPEEIAEALPLNLSIAAVEIREAHR